MVTVPAAVPLANPPPLMDAMIESDELHVTELLMSFVLPSERCAVAENCCVLPRPIAMEDGEIASDETVGDELLDPDDCPLFPEDTPPQPQLSDASINIAIQVTFFIQFPRDLPDARAHPPAFSSGLVPRNRTSPSFPKPGLYHRSFTLDHCPDVHTYAVQPPIHRIV